MAIMLLKMLVSGHVNNDDTDNTNAAIADVKKLPQLLTANNGEAANATTRNNSYPILLRLLMVIQSMM